MERYKLSNNTVHLVPPLIFLSLPRCAGLSFAELFAAEFRRLLIDPKVIFIPAIKKGSVGLSDIKISDLVNKEWKILFDTMPFGFAEQIFHFEKEPFNFCCLREPIARGFSHYYFYAYPNPDRKADMIKEFYSNPRSREMLYFIFNSMTVYMSGMKYVFQGRVEKEALEICLNRAKRHLDLLGVFGFLDEIEDFIKLFNSLNPYSLSIDCGKMPKLNEGFYKETIDPCLMPLIEEIAAYDIQLYDYAKKSFTMRFSHLL
ncbi:MAG: hypothetical protein GYA55_04375 [SAR324 cluster bacterium]|uniref:Sulfotransferase family protein n=1 Tax=SAR324 cluster bacterium TaxID=2024889 RepID=A0A7X9IIT4_9DELT|nr:hypothetical protein [SAR324 cluster bacterium]